MHTLTYFHVKTTSEEKAAAEVDLCLSSGWADQMGCDWWEVGGGRWEEELLQQDGVIAVNAQDHREAVCRVIAVAEKVAVGEQQSTLAIFLDQGDADLLIKVLQNLDAEQPLTEQIAVDGFEEHFAVWRLQKLYDLVNDEKLTVEDHLFSFELGTKNISRIEKAFDEDPEQHFLVPVDLHF